MAEKDYNITLGDQTILTLPPDYKEMRVVEMVVEWEDKNNPFTTYYLLEVKK